MIGAVLLCQFRLFYRRRRSDDSGTDFPSQLRKEQSQSTSNRVDKNGVAFLHFVRFFEKCDCSQALQKRCSGQLR